uniref:START domain-containing protein n=1 Tax=Panagrellus redivivus TaxID=6233 RepID=A0A7E4ZS88_PANRE
MPTETSSLELVGVLDELTPEKEKYSDALKAAGEGFVEAYNIFQDADFVTKKGWKSELSKDDATVHSKNLSFGHVFALRTTLPVPIDIAFRESFLNFDDLATWSENITFSKTIAKLTDHVDVVHYANPDVAVVQSREFLVARIWRKVDDDIYVSARSVKLEHVPTAKGRTRGHLHLGCARFSPDPTDANKTTIDYLLSIDLKGLIPKAIVNLTMAKIILKDFTETKKHYANVLASENAQTHELEHHGV